jgi:hypothetical protein
MKLIGTFAAALLAGAFIPASASASITITGIAGNPGFLTGNVIYTPGGIGGNPARTSQNLHVGRLRLSGVDNSTMQAVVFDSYCIDIFNYLQGGTFDIQAFTLADPVKENQIKRLLSGSAGFIGSAVGSTAKKNVSAAIQMAVWEIVNESGVGGYSLDNGLFQMGTTGSVTPTARAMAQGYLDNLAGFNATGTHSYRMLSAIDPVNNQRQIFLAAAGVPEPSAWALLILGFGLVGGALRKKGHTRRRATAALA